VRVDEVAADRRRAYAETFRNIPRPPKLLHHLLSADFVNASSSAQLVDLIAAEPLLAGRILTVVNSPLYGLKSPMGSIGQAVTYLGLNAVRSLCLQYILIAQFRPDGPERKKLLDATWTTSALTSELTQQLSHRLGFDDRGSLVSAVVLSFIGRLAITAAVSRGSLDSIAHGGLLARTVAEQKVLGLAAAQIGRLLMRDWGLPARIIDDAADIDAVLVTPPNGFAPDRAARLGMCYLAARLGERLALDEGASLADFDPEAEEAPEFFHLRSYLTLPQLARVQQAVRTPDVEAGVRRVRAAMRQA
jgi:HD-like signal output (HDOD) protein